MWEAKLHDLLCRIHHRLHVVQDSCQDSYVPDQETQNDHDDPHLNSYCGFIMPVSIYEHA
jgi:hypothetical protein